MADREAPRRSSAPSRRLVAEDALRWPKIVLGPILLGVTLDVLWTLEEPGAERTRLPLLDRPEARAIVESLLARSP